MVKNIIKNAEKYHKNFYKKDTFTGPSLYFHLKSIGSINSKDFDRYLEYIYATLVSWGMHKMGPKGPKMVNFEDFKLSIDKIKNEIIEARKLKLEKLKNEDFKIIKKIFDSIVIMKNKAILVGTSKVMAHLIPNLIPPVDREYTLRYFGMPSIPQNKDKQYKKFEKLLKEAFYPIASDPKFLKLTKEWKEDNKYKWDTSIPKIIDNLIVGSFDKK